MSNTAEERPVRNWSPSHAGERGPSRADASAPPSENDSDSTRDLVAIRRELARILSSPRFRQATGQARFLKYAVEQTIAGQHIKEQSIGSEAFGRGPLFDSRLDPIVRTQALKLRAKLALYYETDGVNDEIRIEMIKGEYNPRFRRRDGSWIEVAKLAQGRQLSPARAHDGANRDIG